jgi:serine/threonine protein kinase
MVDDLTGRFIRGYELRERIGSGATSVVYRAYQASVQDNVAIKIITAEHTRISGLLGMLQNEAKILRKFMQYNIIPVYDYWQEADGSTYLVMPYFPNGSLRNRLDNKEPLSVEETIRLLNNIANALAAAHEQGIIHCDVKPGNILLDANNNVYLGDFGLAKQIEKNHEASQTDIAAGTVGYVAPEQAAGAKATPQADIFSLGITIFECLAGKHPFPANDQFAYIRPDVELPSLHKIRPDLPQKIDDILRQATAHQPAERYDDVLKFAKAVVDVLKPLEPPTSPAVAKVFPCSRIFISYQRQSSTVLAWSIHSKLQDHGIDSFLDLESLDSGRFKDHIFREIEDRDVFICLLGDNTLKSDWVNREIKHAHANSRPMIPIFQENFQRPKPWFRKPEEHVVALLGYQGIHFFDKKGVYLDDAIDALTNMICSNEPFPSSHGDEISLRPRINLWIMASALVIAAMVVIVMAQIAAGAFSGWTATATFEAGGTQTMQSVAILETQQAAATLSAAAPTVSTQAPTITSLPQDTLTPSNIPIITATPLPTTPSQPATPDVPTADVTLPPIPVVWSADPNPIVAADGQIALRVFNVNCPTEGENQPCPITLFKITTIMITNEAYYPCDAVDLCDPPNSQAIYLTSPENSIIDVSWDMAHAFCGFVGGRLPTAAEWKYAIKGIPNVNPAILEWVADDVPNVPGTKMIVGLNKVDESGQSDTSRPDVGFRCVF